MIENNKRRTRIQFSPVAKESRAKIRETSCGDQFKNLKDWVSFYKEHNRLPATKILCSRCRVTLTSCFADNLKRRLKAYGTVEKLLTTFECKECRTADAPVKEKAPKKPKKEKATQVNSAEADYITVEDMEARKDKVRLNLPVFNADAKPVPYDLTDAACIAELTKETCLYPNRYLDSGCAHCPLVDHCTATICKPGLNRLGSKLRR